MDGKVLLILTLAAGCLAMPEWAPESCACPRVYVPVCASNGRTYNSICEFKCHLSQLQGQGHELYVVRGGRCGGAH